LVVTAVEARLALGEILLAIAAPSAPTGREEILAAARQAEALGLGLLARQARGALARSAAPVIREPGAVGRRQG
jgi:hypothetical protein